MTSLASGGGSRTRTPKPELHVDVPYYRNVYEKITDNSISDFILYFSITVLLPFSLLFIIQCPFPFLSTNTFYSFYFFSFYPSFNFLFSSMEPCLCIHIHTNFSILLSWTPYWVAPALCCDLVLSSSWIVCPISWTVSVTP